MSLETRWRDRLAALDERGRTRRLALPAGVDFSSNDYLGYGRLASPTREELARSGIASRLLRGHHALWDDVEAKLAQWHGAEAALMMTSGYVANEGLLETVIGPDDVVCSDEFNHASLIDGLRLTKAPRHIYRHGDLDHLEENLRQASAQRRPESELFIITESLFGMDGDSASLSALADLAEKHAANLIVDEAHATGCFGSVGSGLVDQLGLRARVLATVHTGGKALGVPGAYIAGTRMLKEYLVNRCRHLIYTTALPPVIAAWWLAAIARVEDDQAARERLHANTRHFRGLLAELNVAAGADHYIVPILLGDDARAVEVADRLQQAGFDIRAIRPPTVPEGTSRLRVSIHADHDAATLQAAAQALADALHR